MKRPWLLWVLVVVFVVVVISRVSELQALVQTLLQGRPLWIAAAFALQFGYLVCYSLVYWSAFRTVGVHGKLGELLPVTLASLFVNVVAPSGAAGAALFVDDAARRGESATRTAAGVLLAIIADFGMFVFLLAAGLILLLLRHALVLYEIIAAALFLAMMAALTTSLILGLWRPDLMRRLFKAVARFGDGISNRLRHRPLLPENWAERNAAEFGAAGQAIAERPRDLVRTAIIGLFEQLLDAASFYALCRAFAGPVSPGVALAGYDIGVLFWIITITPGGIGVVESLLPLALTALGVAGPAATVITLSFRGIAFWLPLFVGFLMLRRLRTFGAREHALGWEWSSRLPALFTGVVGTVNILSALKPALATSLMTVKQYLPLVVIHGGRITAALSGFALLLLSASLWRHKRTAWWITLGALVLAIISHIVKGPDYVEIIPAAVLAIWLLVERRHFHARSDPPSVRGGLRIVAAALAFTLTYGTVGLYLFDSHFGVDFDLLQALRQTLIMFTHLYNPGLTPLTEFGEYFFGSIYVVGAATMGFGLLAVMRPVLMRRPATPAQRRQAAAIIDVHGQIPLARYARFTDKAYHFSAGGSVIAFKVEGRVALALGDPTGPAEDTAAAIEGFRDRCRHNDWIPAFYRVTSENLVAYQAAGFHALSIGEEAIVDLATFDLEDPAHQGLHALVRALSSSGYRAEAIAPPFSEELLAELRAVSDEWLATVNGDEAQFSVGRFEDAYIRSDPVIAVRTPAGIITAFANLLTAPQRRTAALDLRRKTADAIPGTMELLLVSLFGWAEAQGYAELSLGLTALASAEASRGNPAVERVLQYIDTHIDHLRGALGRRSFVAQFQPRWEVRYLIVPSLTDLPAVALALVRADAGDTRLQAYLKDWWERRRLAPRSSAMDEGGA